MDAFLIWLEKYELLIELIITALTITLSLVALFQTKSIAKRQLKQEKNIAKQQADLQERQIKISVYEQKNEINKALNVAFDVATKIRFFFEKFEVDTLEQRKLYDLLNRFVDGVDFKDISYTLEQSRCFLNNDLYQSVKKVHICFSCIGISIDCLDLLKDNEDAKATIINDLRKSYTEIEELQTSIRTAMVNELKLT